MKTNENFYILQQKRGFFLKHKIISMSLNPNAPEAVVKSFFDKVKRNILFIIIFFSQLKMSL